MRKFTSQSAFPIDAIVQSSYIGTRKKRGRQSEEEKKAEKHGCEKRKMNEINECKRKDESKIFERI